MRWIKLGWHRFLLLFVWPQRRTPDACTEATETAQADAQVEERESPEDATTKAAEALGERPLADAERCYFDHFEDLLQQLPLCHRLLKKLRKIDKDAYGFHARVGARLLPASSAVRGHFLNQWAGHLPAQGCVFMPCELHPDSRYEEDGIANIFLYFAKLKTNLWNGVGTVYEVTIVHILAEPGPFKDRAIGYAFHAVVNGDRALAVPMPTTVNQKIHHHDRDSRLHGKVTTHYRGTFQLPQRLVEHFKDREVAYKQRHGHGVFETTAEEFGGRLLMTALNTWVAGVGEWQMGVRATNGGVTTRFDIAVGSPKRFFKDRALEVAVDGRRKRIIHWVTPHDRVLEDGRTTNVVGHFRGVDRFEWQGSDVRVLMPGNIGDARACGVASHYLDEMEDVSDSIGNRKFGGLVAEFEAKYGGRAAWAKAGGSRKFTEPRP